MSLAKKKKLARKERLSNNKWRISSSDQRENPGVTLKKAMNQNKTQTVVNKFANPVQITQREDIKFAKTFAEIEASSQLPITFLPLPPFSDLQMLPVNVDSTLSVLLLTGIEFVFLLDLDNVAPSFRMEKQISPKYLLWAFYGQHVPWRYNAEDTVSVREFDRLCESRR